MLRSWFLRPSTDITLLNQRLKAIHYFISPRNMEALVSLQDGLKSMKNLMVSLNVFSPFSAWCPLKGHTFLSKPVAESCRLA